MLSSLWERKSDTEIKSWPRWNSSRVPLDPKSQSFQLVHEALDEFSWLKRLFMIGFFVRWWIWASAGVFMCQHVKLHLWMVSVACFFFCRPKMEAGFEHFFKTTGVNSWTIFPFFFIPKDYCVTRKAIMVEVKNLNTLKASALVLPRNRASIKPTVAGGGFYARFISR